MKIRQFSLLVLLMFIILLFNSYAWIVPDTHDYIAEAALKQSPGSFYGQLISENYDDFSACMSLVDYSVFFYFQQGFSTIGKVYLGSHNNLICPRAMELADKNNRAEVACALGVCGMEFEDSPSHNGYVPLMIERTGLVNGIIHAPSEECINKKITTDELHNQGISAIVNKYPVHKEFLLKVFQSDERTNTIDVSVMMDAFVAEVTSNKQYTVGFRGFTAVPLSIHLLLLLYFLIGVLSLAYLIKRKNKSLFNKISLVLMLIFNIIPVILVYILYFTGNIWKAFQAVTVPFCWIAPTSGYEKYLSQAVSNMVNLFNYGPEYVYNIPDPSGQMALHAADAGNVWKLWIIGLILLGIMITFIYLNIKTNKKKVI